MVSVVIYSRRNGSYSLLRVCWRATLRATEEQLATYVSFIRAARVFALVKYACGWSDASLAMYLGVCAHKILNRLHYVHVGCQTHGYQVCSKRGLHAIS